MSVDPGEGPARSVVAYVHGDDSRSLAGALTRSFGELVGLRIVEDDRAFAEIAGGLPDRLASAESSRLLAMAAYLDALKAAPRERAVGLGLARGTAGDRSGVFVGAQSAEATATREAEVSRGPGGSALSESAIAEARLAMADLDGPASSAGSVARASPALVRLLHGEAPFAVEPQGSDDGGAPRVLFPGSFRPYHEGHARMARIAARMTGEPVHFELSIRNVDKPPLDYQAIRGRVARLVERAEPHHGRVWLTRAATFAEKAALFPGPLVFVVGFDTLERIGNPRYYEDVRAMERTIAELGEVRGARFLAFPRSTGGVPSGPDDFARLPASIRAIATVVPIDEVRDVLHVASRDLRRLGDAIA